MITYTLHTENYEIVTKSGVLGMIIFLQGSRVGWVNFDRYQYGRFNRLEIDEAYIYPEHQRKGLYIKALLFYQSINHEPIYSHNRSEAANSFWMKQCGCKLIGDCDGETAVLEDGIFKKVND